MTLIPKDIRDLNSEEAHTLQVHHIMGQLIDCLKSVEPAPGNDDAVYLDFWNEMQMDEVLKQAEAWINDNPKPRIKLRGTLTVSNLIEHHNKYNLEFEGTEGQDRKSYIDDQDRESYSPDNYSDDGEALASAGFGTDEDYGGGDERL